MLAELGPLGGVAETVEVHVRAAHDGREPPAGHALARNPERLRPDLLHRHAVGEDRDVLQNHPPPAASAACRSGCRAARPRRRASVATGP